MKNQKYTVYNLTAGYQMDHRTQEGHGTHIDGHRYDMITIQ